MNLTVLGKSRHPGCAGTARGASEVAAGAVDGRRRRDSSLGSSIHPDTSDPQIAYITRIMAAPAGGPSRTPLPAAALPIAQLPQDKERTLGGAIKAKFVPNLAAARR
jgi:hypothetical protein